MAGIAGNILIGLVTSILSGGSVWLWQKSRRSRLLRRKAAFFGLERGHECLIVVPDKYSKPRSVAQHDMHAVIEAAALAHEVGSSVCVVRAETLERGRNDRTELCIGGPISNPRSGGHLAAGLPGVKVLPYSENAADSVAIVVGGERFLWERHHREHVLIAKFTPQGSSCPVIIISGQTALANRAGITFLKREYRALAKTVVSQSRFCVVVTVDSIGTYGHEAATLTADVTRTAFAPVRQPAATS